MLRKLKKSVSLLMVLCMTFTLLPVSAMAAEAETESGTQELQTETSQTLSETEPSQKEKTTSGQDESSVSEAATQKQTASEGKAVKQTAKTTDSNEVVLEDQWLNPENAGISTTSADSEFYKIMFLDCGRKYFSVDSIKKIIDNASAAGFNYIQLAVGNDGMRFLLDDLSLTVNGTTYASDEVSAAIRTGNESYNNRKSYSNSTNELTQSEMDTIIAYAKGKGMGVIPCINTPGHMDSILYAAEKLTGTTCSYNGSARTIDVTNGTAVAFTQAFLQKYINYFKGKGCELFNMGADEYANDIYTSGSMGFGNLKNAGKYSYYIQYVNQVTAAIKEAGMTPMAFNDGIYFQNDTDSGTFDTDILICYWSNGWTDYTPMPASDLNSNGFKLINTHGDYYWVLGKSDWQCDAKKASEFQYDLFQGNATLGASGAMFCIWCDYPGAGTEDSVISSTADTIAAFGATLPQQEVVTLQNNGLSDSNKLKLNKTATLYLSNQTSAVWTSSDEEVATLSSADETSTAFTELNAVKVTIHPQKTGTTTITAVSEGKNYSTEVIVVEASAASQEKTINLAVGQTQTEFIDDQNYSKENTDTDDTGIATVDAKYINKQGSDISYTATASASIPSYSEGTNTYPISNVIDGNTKTFYWSKSAQEVGAYVQVDLGAAISFNAIRLTSTNTDQCNEANVQVSADGKEWQSIGQYSGKATSEIFEVNGIEKVRYIKIEIEKNSNKWWQLAEIEWGNYTNGSFSKLPTSGTISGGTIRGTELTFTGKSVGTTYVTIGDTRYTINVVAEDVSNISRNIEFWITNRPVTANGSTSMNIAASTSTVNSENGAKIADLVPPTGTQDNNNLVLWKATRLTSDKKQTKTSGQDRTLIGDDFAYIRYYGKTWEISADGTEWKTVSDTDQLVAYYLQVTKVTDEVTTEVVDWGVTNLSDFGKVADKDQYVLVDYAVKYQSGDRTPNNFPVSGKTQAFHCVYNDANKGTVVTESNGTYYRRIGLIKAEETADYEVYMITLTPTSNTPTDRLGSDVTSIKSYEYKGTEKVVWVDDEANLGAFEADDLHAEKYHVGGEAIVPELQIAKRQGMLVTYYVRAKVTEDSLSVHYVDKTTGTEFYKYPIVVKSGTIFDEEIKLDDPWQGPLAHGTVINSLDKVQTVSADLATMPEIGAQYRYSNYTCVEVVRSDDGKTVTLYYTFDNTHSFVLDFGLPLTIKASDIGLNETSWTESKVNGATYGQATLNTKEHTLTYTPTKVLQGIERLQLSLTDNKDTTVTHTIYIYPATTVYYEPTSDGDGSGFVTYTSKWTLEEATGKTQAAEAVGTKKNNYGYDAAYNDWNIGNNRTTASSSTIGDSAVFTFTGDGVDIYANNAVDSGRLFIKLTDVEGATQKAIMVDTKTEGGSGTKNYNVPVASITGLDPGKYTVTVRHIKATTDGDEVKTVVLDGFRVYNTIEDSSIYAKDKEDNPDFQELRDKVIDSIIDLSSYDGIYNKDAENGIYEQVYGSYPDGGVYAFVTNASETTQLVDDGPKNELYLSKNQAVTFKVSAEAQIGLKALNGKTTYTINSGEEKNISSNVDMFYSLGPGEITIENTGDYTLAITKVKFTGEDGGEFEEISKDEMISVASSMLEPEIQTAAATLDLKIFTTGGGGKLVATTSLSYEGEKGEKHTFTKSEIRTAVKQAAEKAGYKLNSSSFKNVTVVCGESKTLKFNAKKK